MFIHALVLLRRTRSHINLLATGLLALSLPAFSASHLDMIHGAWDCSDITEEDGFVTDLQGVDHYDADTLSFTSTGSIDMKFEQIPVAKMRMDAHGRFEVDGDVLSLSFTEVNVEVIYGEITTEDVAALREEMLNVNAQFKTLSIDEQEWIALDLEDNTEGVCTRVQSTPKSYAI